MHNKFQILTQTNKLLLFLTYFRKYTSSDSHFILMMSCDVTGGGPMEAPIVDLHSNRSYHFYFRRYATKCKKCVPKKNLLSLNVWGCLSSPCLKQ